MGNNFKVVGNVVGVPNPKPDVYTRAEMNKLLANKVSKEDISGVYKFCGSVETFEDLPLRYEFIPKGAPVLHSDDPERDGKTWGSYDPITHKVTVDELYPFESVTVEVNTVTLRPGAYISYPIQNIDINSPVNSYGVSFGYEPTIISDSREITEISLLNYRGDIVALSFDSWSVIKITDDALDSDGKYWGKFNLENGNVYNVLDEGVSYVWSGNEWGAIGSIIKDDSAHQRIDELEEKKANKTDVYTKSEVYTKSAVYSKEDVYSKEETYSASEIDKKIGAIEVSADISQSANALKGKVSGEIISLDDVSPVVHNMGVKLSSKNEIPKTYTTTTTKGVTFTVNKDGSIVLSGTATSDITYYVVHYQTPLSLINGKSYTLSGSPEESSYNNYYMAAQRIDWQSAHNDVGKSVSFTATTVALCVYITIKANTDVTNVVFKPMLEKGPVATGYKPYVDISTVRVDALESDNLFNDDTSLINLVEYTGFNGSPNSKYGCVISLPCGSYTIKALDEGKTTDYIYANIVDENNNVLLNDSLKIVQQGKYNTVKVDIKSGQRLFVYNGVDAKSTNLGASQKLFDGYKIMLNVGSEALPYEPYIEPTSYTPNADGTVDGLRSVYPNTTLVPSEQGVLVECEYNRDLNKAFEEVVNAIIALGGNV